MVHRNLLTYAAQSTHLSLKGAAVNLVKFGRAYRARLAELERSQWFTAGDLQSLQEERLRAVVRIAYDHVPYYRKIFDERKLRVDDIRTVGDLKKLPLLTKDTLRRDPDAFLARNIHRSLLPSGWTTGSTGAPVNVLRTLEGISFESAMIWRQRRWAGIDPQCRKVAVWGTIWSNTIVPSRQSSPPFWRFNRADHQLLVSYFHLSEKTIPLVIDRLETFEPEIIEGFPSTLLVLADWLKRHKRTVPLRAVFTSSEPLYDSHRDTIESAFETKVFDLYGQAERVVAATECAVHQGLHVNPEYGILELLNGDEDVEPGGLGEIVGTGLNNLAMPLLRYRTGDLARLSISPCTCGREMTLLDSIVGRKADLLMTSDGRTIPGGGLMGAFHGMTNIKRSQIVQDEPGRLTIRIQKEEPEQPVDGALLTKNVLACTGVFMEIEIDIVDKIDEDGRAKYRWVVSHLDHSELQ